MEELGPDIVDPELIHRLRQVCQFSILSLTALGSEMFRLTSQTRGGLFILIVFFYFSFLFGAMFYVETGADDWNTECNSVGGCMYTMMRLTFWDGNGNSNSSSDIKLNFKNKDLTVVIYIF